MREKEEDGKMRAVRLSITGIVKRTLRQFYPKNLGRFMDPDLQPSRRHLSSLESPPMWLAPGMSGRCVSLRWPESKMLRPVSSPDPHTCNKLLPRFHNSSKEI